MTQTDQPTVDQAVAAGQAVADQMLAGVRAAHDNIDVIAEAEYADAADEGIEQAVFCLLVDAATRYAEILGTRRIDDVIQPLVENLEMTMTAPEPAYQPRHRTETVELPADVT